MFCPYCGKELNGTEEYCPYCGRAQRVEPERIYAPKPKTYSLKWHYVLSFAILWIGAVRVLISAVNMLLGSQYYGEKELYYKTFQGLQAVDVTFGLLSLLHAGLMAFTAVSLIRKKAFAPRLLMLVYASSAIWNLLYSIIAASIFSIYADVLQMLIQALFSALMSTVMLLINRVYYKKREHIFFC